MAAAGPLGVAAGGLIGAAAGPVFELIAEQDRQAAQRPVQVVVDAAELAEMTLEQLAAWAGEEEQSRRLDLLVATIEAAWRSRGREHLRALAQVLADGARDDARLDVDKLVADALQDFGPAHLQVLVMFARAYVDYYGSDYEPHLERKKALLGAQSLAEALPHLADGIGAILATLAAHGCLNIEERTPVAFSSGGAGTYRASTFGLTCVEFLERGDSLA